MTELSKPTGTEAALGANSVDSARLATKGIERHGRRQNFLSDEERVGLALPLTSREHILYLRGYLKDPELQELTDKSRATLHAWATGVTTPTHETAVMLAQASTVVAYIHDSLHVEPEQIQAFLRSYRVNPETCEVRSMLDELRLS